MRLLSLASVAVLLAGCVPGDLTGQADAGGQLGSSDKVSDDQVIDAQTELGGACCDAVLPFARAIEAGDYAAAYDAVDPMVFEDVHALQFVRLSLERGDNFEYIGDPDNRIGTVDKARFVSLMTKEEAVGKPARLVDVVEDWSLEGPPVTEMTGRYPPKFPFEKVVATVIVNIECSMDAPAWKALSERAGYEIEGHGDPPYLQIFVVVLDDGGKKKVAHVDFKAMGLD